MFYDDQLFALTHQFEDHGRHYGAVSPPVYLNSLHVYPSFEEYLKAARGTEDDFFYGRMSNPTTRLLEKKLAALEGASHAAVFASGMAAVSSAILATCGAGDHALLMRSIYGPVKQFFTAVARPRLNIDFDMVSGHDLDEIENAIRPNTKLLILESPATFVFSVVDLEAIAAVCRRHGVLSYIDNSYSTPLFQNPLRFGIDIVMHSLSKYLGGHSDVIGGALMMNSDTLMCTVRDCMREWLGASMGPMEGWLVLRGLRSLDARLQVHQRTAMQIAAFLEAHPKVSKVNYPGLPSHPQAELVRRQMRGYTGLLSFETDRKPEDAVRLINSLRLFGKGCSWGGYESLALCPLYLSSDEDLALAGVSNRGLIRLHCGLEGVDSLLEDLSQALDLM